MRRLALRGLAAGRGDRAARRRLVRDRRWGDEELQGKPDERLRGESGRLDRRHRLVRGAARRRRHHARVRAHLLGARGQPCRRHTSTSGSGVNGGISFCLCSKPRTAPPVSRTTRRARRAAPSRVSSTPTTSPARGPRTAAGQGIDAGEFAEILAAMRAGHAYANVHTSKCRRRDPRADQRRNARQQTTRRGRTTSEERPDSRRAITSSVNAAARAPSTTRWSNVTETLPIRRTTISPSRTTGRGPIRCDAEDRRPRGG